MAKSPQNLVWMDLEMTGLDHKNDTILEMATLITDKDLNIIAEGPELVIHHSQEQLDNMNAWCRKHHGDSGLSARVLASEVTLEAAMTETLEFIKKYTLKNKAPLCGNSIGQDKAFLYEYMPEILDWLHYRVIDVSTIKELACRWYTKEQYDFAKKNSHRALDDIKESIDELKFYKEKLFID